MKFPNFNEFLQKLNETQKTLLYWYHHWFTSKKLEGIPVFPQVRVIQKQENASEKTNRYYIDYEYITVIEHALGFEKKKRFTETLSVRPEAYEHIATREIYTKTPSHRSTMDSNGRFLLCYELCDEPLTVEQFNAKQKEVEEEARQAQIRTEHFQRFEDFALLQKYSK